MQGHIHKRVRTDSKGKERTLWYIVVDLGIDENARRRQKWHGSFRTRKEAEVARAKLVDSVHSGTTSRRTGRPSQSGSRTAGCP